MLSLVASTQHTQLNNKHTMEFKASDLRNKLGYPHPNRVCANLIESISDFKVEGATFIGGDIIFSYKFSEYKMNEYLKSWNYESVKDLYKNEYIFRPL
jgi:hypothetical protein